MDVEKLTELWLTFCLNNDNKIDPTIKTLIEMENAVLKKDYKLDNSTKKDMEQQQDTKDTCFIQNEALYPLIFYYVFIRLLYKQALYHGLYNLRSSVQL